MIGGCFLRYTPEEMLYQPLSTVMRTRVAPTELLYAEWKKKQQAEASGSTGESKTSQVASNQISHHLASTASSPALLATVSSSSSRPQRLKDKSYKVRLFIHYFTY